MRFSAKRSAYSATTSKISGVVLGGRCKMLRDRRTWRHGATYQVPTVIKPNPRDGQQLGHVAALLFGHCGYSRHRFAVKAKRLRCITDDEDVWIAQNRPLCRDLYSAGAVRLAPSHSPEIEQTSPLNRIGFGFCFLKGEQNQ
jgi:hypothetical protein